MVANPKHISIPRYAHAFQSDDLADLSAIYEADINSCAEYLPGYRQFCEDVKNPDSGLL